MRGPRRSRRQLRLFQALLLLPELGRSLPTDMLQLLGTMALLNSGGARVNGLVVLFVVACIYPLNVSNLTWASAKK